MIETIIAIIIVAIAAGGVGLALYRTASGEKGCEGCRGCGGDDAGCSPKKKAETSPSECGH